MCAVRSSWVMDKDHDGWHAVSTAMKQMVVVVVVLLLQQGCFGCTTRMLMNDEGQEQRTVLMIWIWIRAQIIGFLKNFVTVSSNVILHVHAKIISYTHNKKIPPQISLPRTHGGLTASSLTMAPGVYHVSSNTLSHSVYHGWTTQSHMGLCMVWLEHLV